MHVRGDGQLGDLVAEEGQLRPNAPAGPRRILSCRPPDQVAKLGVEPRTAHRRGSGLPVPVALEASAVPGQHRGGLDDAETGRQAAQRRDNQTQKTRSPRDRRGRVTDRWRTRS